MDLANFSGRDVIIGIIILVALYLLFSVLRLVKLRRPAKTGLPPHAATDSTLTTTGETTAFADSLAARQLEPTLSQAEVLASSAQTPDASPSDNPEPLSVFEFQLYRNRMDNELRSLRQDIEDLRKALAQIHAAGRVSAQYSEAMALALRGIDPQIIAERCAISLGEAELVAALSRNEEDYGNENVTQ